MSDEPENKPDKTVEWSMPEPIFRSTEGRPPGRTSFEDSQMDIPTEPGFKDGGDDDDVVAAPTEPAPVEPPTPHPPSGAGGCARTALSMIGIVAFGFAALVGLLIYFIVYYRSSN